MKGIILAGGSGSRLHPLTVAVNKHLLPVGEKPMVTHCVEKLTEAGIEDILIVTNPEYVSNFSALLKSGDEYNCDISYRVQEKPAGIANPKDFRSEVVNFVLRTKAKNKGKNPRWSSYEKLREIIEKKMFASTEELLPIISFGNKQNKEDQQKHDDFVNRMEEKGYTDRQVRRLVEWYMRTQKSS